MSVESTRGFSLLEGGLRRRSILRASVVAGALMATGLPTLAMAQDNNNGKGNDKDDDDLRRGPHKAGLLDVSGTTSGGAAFKGVMRITKFQAVAGSPNQLVASGVLRGKFRDQSNRVIATVDDVAFSAPVTSADDPGCTILHLVLAPLTLNLLGLVLTIPDTITIDLTAIPGGGLLGDLLCAVDNLLQGGLGNLLNNLLGLTNLATALTNLFNALNNL
jgi:hypothetical protein